MKPHAIELIQNSVKEEMVKVQKHLYFPSIESITPSFISGWSKETIIQPVIDLVPVLTGVLLRAAESKSAKGKNKTKAPHTVSLSGRFLFILYLIVILSYYLATSGIEPQDL